MSLLLLSRPRVVASAPEPPADDFTPNLPSGYTLLGDTTWELRNPAGWENFGGGGSGPVEARGEVDVFNNVEPGPFSTWSLRHKVKAYDAAFHSGGTNGGITYPPMPAPAQTREIYFSAVVKANGLNSAPGTHWFNDSGYKWIITSHPRASGPGGGAILGAWPVGAITSGIYSINRVDIQEATAPFVYRQNLNGYTGTGTNSYPMNVGEWYRVEVKMVASTPTLSDGEIHIWIARWDGTAFVEAEKVMEHTNVKWFDNATDPGHWRNAMKWDTYFGGGPGAAGRAEQYWWWNRNAVYYKPL